MPGHIIFTTATVQQPHDRLLLIYTVASIGSRWRPIGQLLSSHHASARDFDDLNLSTPTLAAVVERVEDADIRLSRDVESRVFSNHMHRTMHSNSIRDNAYKLMIHISDSHWGNKSGFADTLRQKLGRQPPGTKAVLFTYRLIVGSPRTTVYLGPECQRFLPCPKSFPQYRTRGMRWFGQNGTTEKPTWLMLVYLGRAENS